MSHAGSSLAGVRGTGKKNAFERIADRLTAMNARLAKKNAEYIAARVKTLVNEKTDAYRSEYGRDPDLCLVLQWHDDFWLQVREELYTTKKRL